MASEWMKVEHSTPDKPEVLALASLLGISPDEAFGKCFRMWRWFDKETIAGVAPGVGLAAIDHVVGLKGFAAAMVRVGWLLVSDPCSSEQGAGTLTMPEFEKHCGEGAKTRSLTARRVARHAGKEPSRNTNAASVSDGLPAALATALPRKEKGEREEELDSNRERPDRPIGHLSGQSPMDFAFGNAEAVGNAVGEATWVPASPLTPGPSPRSGARGAGNREAGEPLDVSGVDWERVASLAEALARKVPPWSDQDRRAWLRYAVLVEVGMFAEHWLLDAAEAVAQATERKRSKQAHLVAVLKAKAAEEGTPAETLRAILQRIEIPIEVWKSSILPVRAAGGSSRRGERRRSA